MSDVNRDPIRWERSMTQDKDGQYVSYHDYAVLLDSHDRLRAELAAKEKALSAAKTVIEAKDKAYALIDQRFAAMAAKAATTDSERECNERLTAEIDALTTELAEARRLLDEARKQEPDEWRCVSPGGTTTRRLQRPAMEEHKAQGWTCKPLYAAPVPAHPAVPVRFEDRNGAMRDTPSDCVRFGANGFPSAIWYGGTRYEVIQVDEKPAVPDDVARDAARYRFLRSDGRRDVYVFEHYLSRKELDAAIDAAIISATEGRSNG